MNTPIVINQTEIVHIIRPDEIVFCKADGSYCTVHLSNGEIITNSRTLACLSKQLNGLFVRISHSVIVNKHYIRKIIKKKKCIELCSGVELFYTVKSSELLKNFIPGHESSTE
jgi:two-component system LytT family response regulator